MRGRRNDDDFFGPEARDNLDDAVLEGRAAHDGVVEQHQGIHIVFYQAVSNIINVGDHGFAGRRIGDEGALLSILDDDFVHSRAHG